MHEDLDLAIHTHRLGYKITYRESLKVGIKIRRVRSARHELLDNLMLWPKTLKSHGRWTWIFGWLGAVILFAGWPIVVAAEGLARLFGRVALEE